MVGFNQSRSEGRIPASKWLQVGAIRPLRCGHGLLDFCYLLERECGTQMPAGRKAAIEKYRQVRRESFARMAELRDRMDAWLEAHEDREPAMADLATLEGLHGERLQIVAELESAERGMIDAILRARPSETTPSAEVSSR